MVSLSLLERRALALVHGLAAGESLGLQDHGRSEANEATRSALGLARAAARLGRIDEASLRRVALEGELNLSVWRVEEFEDSLAGAASALAVGIARRPQDYNGIVDDVVSIIAIHRYTSQAVAGGCAVAAAVAALLDGWDLEGAVALAATIAKRGSTFGRKAGPVTLPGEIWEVWARVDEHTIGRAANLERALEAIEGFPPLPRALGIAYACRDAGLAVKAAAALPDHQRITGAIAGSLCAAFRPDSLPGEWAEAAAVSTRALGFDPERIALDLLALRLKKWSLILG